MTVGREGRYRSDVQALRGVAVLLVVAFHAWPSLLPGGYVGVDVFFVISGYLITGLLLREIQTTGRIDFAAFYARRIRRLLPAAALVIATTAIVVAWLYSPLEAGDFAPTVVVAMLYVSNVWFALLSVDYLQEGLHRNALLHTWSLGVEEQFYLVWPVLIAGSTLLLRRAGTLRAVAATVAGVSALSFVGCLWLTAVQPSWAFFSLPTRAWELGVGAAAALLESRAQTLDAAKRRTVVLAGLLCIVAAGVAFSARTAFPGHAALLPVGGAFLVVLGGAGVADGKAFGPLRLTALQRLGDLSYSWYLWHWPVLIFIAEAWPAADRNLVAVAGVALSLALAQLTYSAVENPVRYRLLQQARPSRTIALGLMLMIGTVGIVVAGRFASFKAHEADNRQRMAQAARDRPRLYDDKCFAAALDTEPPECIYGAADGRHTVALIGDSHAAQWFPALEGLAAANGLRLAVFVKAACPLAIVAPYDPKLNREYVECTQWREKVFERLARMRPTLVIGGNAAHYEPFIRRDREALQRWKQGLEASLDRLVAVASHVVVIRDTPRPGFHVPGCLARTQSRSGKQAPECPYFLSESLLPDAFEVEQAAMRGRTNVALVDMNDAVCTTQICPVKKDDMVLFHDSQHLSATFARSLAAELWRRLPDAARADLSR